MRLQPHAFWRRWNVSTGARSGGGRKRRRGPTHPTFSTTLDSAAAARPHRDTNDQNNCTRRGSATSRMLKDMEMAQRLEISAASQLESSDKHQQRLGHRI
eukprot:701740-Rhodomonas_salina.2